MRRLVPTPAVSPPRVALSSADRELLIQRVLEAVHSGRPAIQKRSQEMEVELMLRNTLPVGSVTEVDASMPMLSLEEKVVLSSTVPWRRGSCFSCGRQGHGVTRCSRMDVSFPFLLPGWSVDVRNGQYRASRIRGDGRNYTPGKVGWSGREGQPPGSSETIVQLTPGGGGRVLGARQPARQQPVGCVRESRWTPNAQGFPTVGSHSPVDDGRRERPVPDDSGDVSANDPACRTRSMLLCRSIWRKSSRDRTVRWGILVTNSFVTSFIAIDMFFPAPGEPVTGRTTSVQHDSLTSDARPVRCEPRRLAPGGLRTEQTCVQEMLLGGQIESSDSPWASPVVLVTKKTDQRALVSITAC